MVCFVPVERIGIFGGSFDPVHAGHLALARRALEAVPLDRVLFAPAADSPFKVGRMNAPAEDRLAMLELAIAGEPRFGICRADLDRGGVSYTVDLVADVRAAHPDAELFFLLGADSLAGLHRWRRAAELVAMCRFVGFGRPGFRLDPDALGFDPATNARLAADFVPDFAEPASSTEVRARLAAGEDVSSLLPSPVAAYIRDRGLYRPAPAPSAPRANVVSIPLPVLCFELTALSLALGVAGLLLSLPFLGIAFLWAAGGFLLASVAVRAVRAGKNGGKRTLAFACTAVLAVASFYSFFSAVSSFAAWRAPYDISDAFGDDAYPGLIEIVGFRYHPPTPWSESSYEARTEFRAASPRFFCEETDSGAERVGADVARLAIRKARKAFRAFRPDSGEAVFVVARNGAPRWTIVLGENPSECVVLAE